METVQHRPERSGESCHGFAALPKSARRADFPLLRGERVPVGGRSPVENSAVASDIAERAPPGHSNRSDPFSFVNSVVAGRVPPAHSNRADRRDRWCEPFSAVASGAKRRKPWLSWRIVLHRPNRQVRPLLGVPHRGTATEPTGEKAKGCHINYNLAVTCSLSVCHY